MQSSNIIKRITYKELDQLTMADASVKLIDVRDQAQYAKEHIPGAISLPLEEIREKANKLLNNKEDTIITYCSGVKCQGSTNAAKVLLSLDYKNVLDYKGGLEDYKKQERFDI